MGRHGDRLPRKSVAAHTQACQSGAVTTRVDLLVFIITIFTYKTMLGRILIIKALEERQLTSCQTMTLTGSRDTRLGESVELRDRTRFRFPGRQTSMRMIQDSLSGLEAVSGRDLTGAGRGTSEDLRKESVA